MIKSLIQSYFYLRKYFVVLQEVNKKKYWQDRRSVSIKTLLVCWSELVSQAGQTGLFAGLECVWGTFQLVRLKDQKTSLGYF